MAPFPHPSLSSGLSVWQHDLAISQAQIGEVFQARDKIPIALISYQTSRAIFERLAKSNPGNAFWLRDLIITHVRSAEVDPPRSRTFLTYAVVTAQQMQRRGQLAAVDPRMLDELARRIAVPSADPQEKGEK
jgi:hypothetical protein